jgi:integrase
MKKEKLPRGVRRRGHSLTVCFALEDGRIERRSLGMASPGFAKEQLMIFKRQVREGTYQKKQPRQTAHTVADLWESYLVDYKNRGGKDIGRLEIAWNHLKAAFGHKRIDDVSTDLVNQYIESRRVGFTDAKTLLMRNGTVNRETALLRAMFFHGTKITPPMVIRVPAFPARLKESPARKGFVTDKEYAVLAAHAKPLWLRTLIACAYSFGFRKGELLNLRVGQVDLLDRWIDLGAEDTKTDAARKIPMTAEVFELLVECIRGKRPDDYVFTRDDGSHVVDPRDDWYSLCVQSKLGVYVSAKRRNGKEYDKYVGLTLHDFRRSAIRNMTRRGIGEVTAMRISGHKTASVFRRYNIVAEADLVDAARRIEAGRQSPTASSTKSDTSVYAESPDSRKSLN